MKIEVYMNYNRNASLALKRYKEVFQTEEPKIMYYKDMPGYLGPEGDKELVLHSLIRIGNIVFHASDTPSEGAYVKGNNISLMVACESVEEVERFYGGLKKNSKEHTTPTKTFFAKSYATVEDEFGIRWQFIYE